VSAPLFICSFFKSFADLLIMNIKKIGSNQFVFFDIESLSKKLSNNILKIAKRSINVRGCFKIVLAGGTSLISTYKILCKAESDWGNWHIYIGDERCLPLNDKIRNDYNINKVWLKNSLIPKKNINFIHSELGVENGALHYERVVENIGYFDVVLLGIGEDGHTASLFPGHVYNDKDIVIERNSPKYPKNRISMSYSRLNKSRFVFKVISGSSKSNFINFLLKGKSFPVNNIKGKCEKIYLTHDVIK